MHFHHATITFHEGHPLSHQDEIRKAETLAQRNDRIRRWYSARKQHVKQLGTSLHEQGDDRYADRDGVMPFVTIDDVHDLLRETASERIERACRRVESAALHLESEVGDAVGDVRSLVDELDPNVKTDDNGARATVPDSERLAALLAVFDWFHNDMKHTGAWRHCTDALCRVLGEAAGER